MENDVLMMGRDIFPELLDSLDPKDPEAIRSRGDLRRLDDFLGGSRWIVRSVRSHVEAARAGIVELGAGEGILCERLARRFPGCSVTGLDRVPAPVVMSPCVRWVCGDFLGAQGVTRGGMAVGSLILHHFSREELGVLGTMLREFRALLFSEPWRSRLPLALSFFCRPFFGRVTKHDMTASIRAGFCRGELAGLLGLSATEWHVKESLCPQGTLRFHAWRD